MTSPNTFRVRILSWHGLHRKDSAYVYFGLLILTASTVFTQDINPDARQLFQQAVSSTTPDQKIRALEAALCLSPQYVDARVELAKVLVETQQYRRALSQLDMTLNYDRQNATVWYWKGRAHHAQGDTANAAKSYRRALKLQPNFSEGKTYLSRIENQPKLEAWYQAAEDDFRRSDWSSAEKNYQRILEIAPDFRDVAQKLAITRDKIKAQALADSAQTLRQKQKFDDAIKLLQEAISIDPERKSEFQVQIKQIEQEKARAQGTIKSEKPVTPAAGLPAPTRTQNDSAKPSPFDSSTGQPQEPNAKRAWPTFSMEWIAIVGTTLLITLAGMRLGSPPYMSPEQIEAKDIDGRTDVYSLGTVFYEMLTGAKPFTMNERENLSPLFYAILHTDPPKLTLVRPEVPATIEAIIEKMLAKNPERRYQNAGEIIEALNSLR